MAGGLSDIAKDDEQPRSDLVQLVYLSLAVGRLSPYALECLGERSRQNNTAAGITGMLIAHGPYFYGVMEGAHRKVLRRMEVIITDRRHRGLRILREEPITARRFENWTFVNLPESEGKARDQALPGRFILDLSQRLRSTS